jgi:phage host-nuclease inhibitor protein Gam
MPLSKVKDMAAQYKVRQEKIADEVEKLGGIPFEVNEQNVITDFEEEKAKMRALYSNKKRSMNAK